MAKITVKDLLEAGVHFGHQTKRWNPKMKNYVYGAKNGISIIDITKTMHQLAAACNFLQHVVADGKDVLFVGTKRQAQQIIKDASEKTDMYHVSERWLGGTLTNNVTIRKSISKMYEFDKILDSDASQGMKKKELASYTRKSRKLHRDLDGIASMKKLPGVLIIVDVCHDNIAVREANKLKIPIVAVVDTNADPEPIDFPVAANDDAVKSIKLIMDLMTDSVMVAKEIHNKRVVEEKAKADAEKAAKEKAAAEKAAEVAEAAKAQKAAKELVEKSAPKKSAPKKPAAPKAAPKKEAKAEAPKAEVKEAPKKEAKAAPKKEAKAEAPKAEVKEAPKKEAKAAPKKEAKAEAPKAEVKEAKAAPKKEAKEEKPKVEAKAEEVKEEKTPAAKKPAAKKPAAKKEVKAEEPKAE
jgi:small subunit ribosomal protein S2